MSNSKADGVEIGIVYSSVPSQVDDANPLPSSTSFRAPKAKSAAAAGPLSALGLLEGELNLENVAVQAQAAKIRDKMAGARQVSSLGIRRAPTVKFTEVGASPGGLARIASVAPRAVYRRMSTHFFKDRFVAESVGEALEEYIDVETGDKVVATAKRLLDPKRFRKVDARGSLTASTASVDLEKGVSTKSLHFLGTHTFRDLVAYYEIDPLGVTWRRVLRSLVLATRDEPNALRLTRGLATQTQFLTAYESFLVSEIIRGYHSKDVEEVDKILTLAFNNRNVSRVVVNQLTARHDYFWHTFTQLKYNRRFEILGSIPILSWYIPFALPATENFPNTRTFVINSFFRQILGKGYWWTRALTNRQAILTDDPNIIAQNLAAEGNGFEAANRNQHGTYFGREKTNAFRVTHRLPVDESIVRTFVVQPLNTLVNNGIEHTIRQLARHWHNMLYQPWGNFAHQRGEQLIPFEFLRFHTPSLLVALAAFRGFGRWDAEVLAPFVNKLQWIQPVDDVDSTRELLKYFQNEICVNVCGGIASRVDALRSLFEAVDAAIVGIQEESVAVRAIIESVERGIVLGMEVVRTVDWRIPNNRVLNDAVYSVCMGEEPDKTVDGVAVRRALNLLSSKDKRTVIELCKAGLRSTLPCQLLLTRTVTLLQRELRRDAVDIKLRKLSKGNKVPKTDWLKVKKAYWLEDGQHSSVYIYLGKRAGTATHHFIHRTSRHDRFVEEYDSAVFYDYIEYAETITRAQKAFMTIELDHQRKYSYAALGEFAWMRGQLRDLVVVCQLHSYELDDARLNILQAMKDGAQTERTVEALEPGQTYFVYEGKQYEPYHCVKKYSPDDPDFDRIKTKRILSCPPQSVIVIGGGPTGLLTTIHCAENVLYSDGTIKLWESRDAFTKAGATFERSQIVRLDARWISMLRYHLGTIFEDVFIPASCETSSHFGNVLPPQGFIEITIKDMENMMNIQVAKMASRGLVEHISNSGAAYNPKLNKVIKLGKALHKDDYVLRKTDPSGKPCDALHTWKVVDLIYAKALLESDLHLGEEYSVYVHALKKVAPFRLIGANIVTRQYVFQAMDIDAEDISGPMPSVYPKGVKVHSSIEAVLFECIIRDTDGSYAREELPLSAIENKPFVVDIGRCHIAEAIGKPHGSAVHWGVTTYEPYGVCCLSGLKVSWGMHNFGTRRWATGVVDDLRSHTDQNTRVIGDFTKVVNSKMIAMKMVDTIREDLNWRLHFEKLVCDLGYEDSLKKFVYGKLCELVIFYENLAPYRRSHLQTRFFETGDNFYLGMEFTREYDEWKGKAVNILVGPAKRDDFTDKETKNFKNLKATLEHHIDRLWYFATLETIAKGDVYNPGGQSKVPRLYLIDSLIDVELKTLGVGESFRLVSNPSIRYEVMVSNFGHVVVRDFEGYVSKLNPQTKVRLGGNLTRGPDGVEESKVAIATFPVGHYVNHRAMRLSSSSRGYVYAALGDEQSSPHFMRYSGLTGAAINCMSFNNFLGSALDGIPFLERFAEYVDETNWSNGEVVQRGTGANYGEDGFLRPGFAYKDGAAYMYSKAVEHYEAKQDMNQVFSRDWKIKFAAALIPRGIEYNVDYIQVMLKKMQDALFDEFISRLEVDDKIPAVGDLCALLKAKKTEHESDDGVTDWLLDIVKSLDSPEVKQRLDTHHVSILESLELALHQIVDYSRQARENNERITSQMSNQPKPVDTVYDDFAVEAQGSMNALAHVSTMLALALSLEFVTNIGAIIATFVSFWIATGTITNSSRYKNRNEAWRVRYADEQYLGTLKAVYERLTRPHRLQVASENNPFVIALEAHKEKFVKDLKYYNYPEPTEFLDDYKTFISDIHNVAGIKEFLKTLSVKYLADKYFVSSYLQQDLVNIYTVAAQLLEVESFDVDLNPSEAVKELVLYERLLAFKPRLDTSLQRGLIYYGAFQKRALKHSHVVTIVHFLWVKVYEFFFGRFRAQGCLLSLPSSVDEVQAAARVPIKPVAVETEELLAQMRISNETASSPSLNRAIMDVESLYFATKESYFTSFVVVSGLISFCTGLVFSVGNIGFANNNSDLWAQYLQIGGGYSFGIASPIPSFVSFVLILRMLSHQIACDAALTKKIGEATDDVAIAHLTHIRKITRIQEVANAVRAIATGASTIALPWALTARRPQQEFIFQDPYSPLWLAVAAICLNSLVVFFLYIIEFTALYELSPKLGEYVCVAFDEEIQQIYENVQVTDAGQPDPVNERITYEYVARAFLHKYRFDTIFLQNRFGSILQFIQSGVKRSLYAVPGRESNKKHT